VTLRSSASRKAFTLLSERPAAGARRAVLRVPAVVERLRVAPLRAVDLDPADFEREPADLDLELADADRADFELLDLEPPDLEPPDLVAISSSSTRSGG
jgi:hypothetical protein